MHIVRVSCNFLGNMALCPIQKSLPSGLHLCVNASGLCMPSVPLQDLEAVLAYLSRYTHRVAISNSRLISLDERGVTFRWKDYRAKEPATPKDHDALCR